MAASDTIDAGERDALVAALLGWYDRHRRVLPWRAPAGCMPEPYHVWLSEIMLQQTTVATVGPYFRDFVQRWPSVHDLAAVDLDAVLHAWQGLGYYARARNLHKCAIAVSREHGGVFPETEEGLLALPGVGRYTAAAIAAIAFGRSATVVDGNVERVMARLFRLEAPLPGVKTEFYRLAGLLTPAERAGDYAQGVMDLGATVCTPRSPKCILCPWRESCAGRDIAERLPAKAPKGVKPTRRGIVFWLQRPDGAVLLRRRQESGLLGGMMEVPSTDWQAGEPDPAGARSAAPIPATAWRVLPGLVRHTFTHFHLELTVMAGLAEAPAPTGCRWRLPDAFADEALPTVMKKVVRHALAHL